MPISFIHCHLDYWSYKFSVFKCKTVSKLNQEIIPFQFLIIQANGVIIKDNKYHCSHSEKSFPGVGAFLVLSILL